MKAVRATFMRMGTVVLLLLLSSLPVQARQAGAAPPPDIVQLIQKMSKGQELTDAEQQKLDDWSAAQDAGNTGGDGSGASSPAPAGGPASLLGASRDNDDLKPCPTPPSRAPNAAVPEAKGYMALVTAIQARLKLKLAPAQFVTLEQNLSGNGKPQDASNVGLFLLTQNMGSAGAYAITKSALGTPADATYANNLGLALRGLGGAANLADAEKVLLYAASQDKKSGNIPTNLGWLALDQKRVDAAQTYFKVALVNNPEAPQAMAGLGLIALCQGHPKLALPMFRGSLQNGFTDFAEAGLRTAEGVLGQSAKGQQILAQTPPLFPDVKGVAAGDDVYWKLPPFDSNAITDALPESKQPLQTYQNDLLDVLKGAQARLTQQALADRHNLDRAPTRTAFVLADIQRLTEARLSGPQDALVQAQTDASADLEKILNSQSGKMTCSTVKVQREQALAVHTRFFPVYAASVHQIDAVLSDMWALGSPWIAHMKYSSDQAGENVARVTVATSAFGVAAQQASLYQGWLSAAMMPNFVRDSDNNSCPVKPAEVLHPMKLGKLKTFPDKGCKLPTESMSLIFASYQADCTGIHLAFGEGPRFKLDYTFGKDWASDSLTITGGAGFVEGITLAGGKANPLGGKDPSVSAGSGGEVGGYITFTGIGQLVPAFDNATSAAGVQNLADTVKSGAEAFAADPAKYIADYGSAGSVKVGISGGDIAKVEMTATEKLSGVTGFTPAVSNSSGLGPNTNWGDVN